MSDDEEEHMELHDLYPGGEEEGSQIDEEQNVTSQSQKSPAGASAAASYAMLDASDVEFTSTLKYSSPIVSLALYVPRESTGAPLIITGSDDHKAVVWDLKTGKKIRSLKGEHSACIMSVAVYVPFDAASPALVITGSADETAIVWDLESGEKMFVLKDEEGGEINAVAVSPPVYKDSYPLLTTGNNKGVAVVWNLITGKKHRTLEDGHTDSITSISAYSIFIATASEDCTAIIWNLNTGERLRTLNGHIGAVRTVTIFRPAEEFAAAVLVTGADDLTLIVWDFFTGTALRVLEGGHTAPISCLTICSPMDGSFPPLIVSGSDDATAVLWELESGKMLRKIDCGHTNYINSIAVYMSEDGASAPRVITGSEDSTVMVWELSKDDRAKSKKAYKINSRGLITMLHHEEAVYAVAVHTPQDGKSPPLVITATSAARAIVYDLASAKKMFELSDPEHKEFFRGIAVYSPPEYSTYPPMVVIACEDKCALVFDLSTGKKIFTLDGHHEEALTDVVVYTPPHDETSPPYAVTCSCDRTAIVWSLKDGEMFTVLKGEHTDYVNAVAIYVPPRPSPNSPYVPLVLTASNDETIVVWEMKSGKKVRTIRDETGVDGSDINCVAVYEPLDRSTEPIVLSGDEYGWVRIWDLKTGEMLRTLAYNHASGLSALAIHTPLDNNTKPFVVSVSRDRTAVVWDLFTGRCLRTLQGVHDDEVNALAIYSPPDSSTLPFVVTAGEDQCCVVWDLNAEMMQNSIEGGHAGIVKAVAVFVPNVPDAEPLAITGSGDGTVVVWDLKTGKKKRCIDDKGNYSITCLDIYVPAADDSSNPILIYGTNGNVVSFWNLTTYKRIRFLKDHTGPITSLAVYNPGALVVTASEDCSAIVWNIRSGKKVRTIKAHSKPVTAVAIYTNTRKDDTSETWLITGSTDTTAVITDLNTGRRISDLSRYGHEGRISCIAVYRGAEYPHIVTGSSEDKSIIIWNSLGGIVIRKFTVEAEVHTLAVYTPPDDPTAHELIACSAEGVISTYEISTGELIRTLESEHNYYYGSVLSMALYAPANGTSPPMLVTGGTDEVVAIWNYKSGRDQHLLKGGHGNLISTMAVYAGTEYAPVLITGSHDNLCIVWEIASGKRIHALQGATDYINSLVVCPADPEGGYEHPLVIAGCSTKETPVWDLFTAELQAPFVSEADYLFALCKLDVPGPDDKIMHLLVTCHDDHTVCVWRISTREKMLTFPDGHTAAILSVVTHVPQKITAADPPLIITGAVDKTIVIWSYPMGQIIRKLEGVHTEAVRNLAIYQSPYEETAKEQPPIYLVSGGQDRIAVVWDVKKGKSLHTLKKHDAPVTSVLIYETSGIPLVITGGEDDLVIVWDLVTGKDIRTMEGFDMVTTMAIYQASDGLSTARILSASRDKTVNVWADCLLPNDYMPLAGSVEQMMKYELSQAAYNEGHETWSRMNDASTEYGEVFWLENYRFFVKVFEPSVKPTIRDSFYRNFKQYLPLVIHLLPPVVYKGKERTLLEVCIEENLDIRRIVIDAWITALNSANYDYLYQANHPSTMLAPSVLLKLAELYPDEFISFICRLKLIKSHSTVYKTCPTYNIDRKGGLIIEGMPSKLSVDMWAVVAGYFTPKNATTGVKGDQPVTGLMIPLIGVADLKMLSAFVDTSNAVSCLDIFESEVGVIAFKYAWQSFGFKIHVITTLRYLTFIAMYTISVFYFDRLQKSEFLYIRFWAWLIQGLVLIYILYYFYDETLQFWNENKDKVLAIKQQLLDRKERAKELKRKALENVEEEKDPKYLPGQHRRQFLARNSGKIAASRRNPALYTGFRFFLATIEVKIIAMVRNLGRALWKVRFLGDYIVQAWQDSMLRMILKHFSGFWNIIDMSVIGLVTAGTILRISNGHETDSSRCVLSIGCVIVWFKILNFMRPFKHSGPLIAMILRIMQDIQYFVLILGIVLTGFAMAFWIISYPNALLAAEPGTAEAFATIENAFYSAYLYMLGQNMVFDFNAMASPQLGVVLVVMFMFFMMILMLNLLIALMGNSYSKVQEKGLAEWRLGQASMILEQSYMMSTRTKKIHENFTSIHVLKYTTLLPDEEKQVEVTDAQLSALKTLLETKLAALEKKIDDSSATDKKNV